MVFRVTNNNVDNMALKNKFMIEPTIFVMCVFYTLVDLQCVHFTKKIIEMERTEFVFFPSFFFSWEFSFLFLLFSILFKINKTNCRCPISFLMVREKYNKLIY